LLLYLHKILVSCNNLLNGPPVNEDLEAFEHVCAVLSAEIFSNFFTGGNLG